MWLKSLFLRKVSWLSFTYHYPLQIKQHVPIPLNQPVIANPRLLISRYLLRLRFVFYNWFEPCLVIIITLLFFPLHQSIKRIFLLDNFIFLMFNFCVLSPLLNSLIVKSGVLTNPKPVEVTCKALSNKIKSRCLCCCHSKLKPQTLKSKPVVYILTFELNSYELFWIWKYKLSRVYGFIIYDK